MCEVFGESGSLPLRERGLKFRLDGYVCQIAKVAPLAGAWIEIRTADGKDWDWTTVAPLAGAWIEISFRSAVGRTSSVAPLAGAWIEIHKTGEYFYASPQSLPLRERGLKYDE